MLSGEGGDTDCEQAFGLLREAADAGLEEANQDLQRMALMMKQEFSTQSKSLARGAGGFCGLEGQIELDYD